MPIDAIQSRHCMCRIPYSGKLSREKLSWISQFVAICESFLCKVLGCGILWHGKNEQSMKFFSTKIVFFINLRKFSPLKVSLYTVSLGHFHGWSVDPWWHMLTVLYTYIQQLYQIHVYTYVYLTHLCLLLHPPCANDTTFDQLLMCQALVN